MDTDFPVVSFFLSRSSGGKKFSSCLELLLLFVIQLHDVSTMIYLLIDLCKSKTQLDKIQTICNM